MIRAASAFVALSLLSAPALADPVIGAPAQNFALTDSNGRNHRLSDYKGKTVVLEWNNPGCPFVQKHYSSGNMQKLQAAARADGIVWLTINSGAPGKQGHIDGAGANALVKEGKANPAAYLLDPKGVVGKAYAATTTPEMFIVDPAGTLVYKGGIDDKPTANVGDIASARNHVTVALAELKAGKPVSVAETRSYGCSVKYPG